MPWQAAPQGTRLALPVRACITGASAYEDFLGRPRDATWVSSHFSVEGCYPAPPEFKPCWFGPLHRPSTYPTPASCSAFALTLRPEQQQQAVSLIELKRDAAASLHVYPHGADGPGNLRIGIFGLAANTYARSVFLRWTSRSF